MKEGASVLGAELTESVAVSSLESDVYISFIIPIGLDDVEATLTPQIKMAAACRPLTT